MHVEDDPQTLDLRFWKTKRGFHTTLVFVLTFLAYTSFHLSRKPASIVKSTLHPSAPHGYSKYDPETHPGWRPFNNDLMPSVVADHGFKIWKGKDSVNGDYSCDRATIYQDACIEFARNDGGASILRTDIDPTGNTTDSSNCWEIRSGASAVYVQTKAEAPKGGCQSLPATTTETSTQWRHAGSLSSADKVQVAPKVTNGKILLGSLDTIFLAMYAVGMFFSGYIGDRVNLRLFLTLGMLMSGILVAFQGLAYYWKIHSFGYFAVFYGIQGLFQSIGWPSVVAVMGNWVAKGTRGLPLGVWNAHTSVGNILGSLISVAGLSVGLHGQDWPAAFFLCGGCIFFVGCLVFFFLHPHPNDVGLSGPNDDEHAAPSDSPILSHMSPMNIGGSGGHGDSELKESLLLNADRAIAQPKSKGGILTALRIPGVIPFALALLFAKLVAYTFIYWLPLYLTHLNYTSAEAGQLSTFFDLGGILGGIIAGYLSDKLKMPGVVSVGFLLAAIPSLYMYRSVTKSIGDKSTSENIALMLFAGAIVNGPYALITTAISADLGTHKSLKGQATLMATVTSIIDGTGSIGAALQGVLIGWLSARYSWNGVFYLLNVCSGLSALCLLLICVKECKRKCGSHKSTPQ